MKKRINTLALLFSVILIFGCKNTLDNQLNKDDFDKVKAIIQSETQYSEMKKKYILDNLSMQLGFTELGKLLNVDKSKIPTFRNQIDDLASDYDSLSLVQLKIKENNEKLKNFVSLKSAKAYSFEKYKGYLGLTLDFNNQFEKEILYVVLNYKYVNKYDSKFFDEKAKITDEVAKDFRGTVEITLEEQYNDVAEFMYTKVPIKAKQELINELGEEKANEKAEVDFLMEGLKISILAIVFKDKSELIYQEPDLEYWE